MWFGLQAQGSCPIGEHKSQEIFLKSQNRLLLQKVERLYFIFELGEAGFALREVGRSDRRPASLWHVAAGAADGVGEYPAGSVGIIASVTAPFCADCDRTRITADGRLMTCLFSARETDLRGPMRAGASDDELIRVWAGATWHKPLAHGANAPGPASGGFVRPGRTMSAIGG